MHALWARGMAAAVVAVVVIATMAVGTGAAEGRTYFRQPLNNKAVVKPKKIEFSDVELRKLSWRHWGDARTRAHGRARINTCNPSCADGNLIYRDVSVKLSRRHKQGGRRFYTCLDARVQNVQPALSHITWGNCG